MKNKFEVMLITNDINVGLLAEDANVDRIFIDLELNGKFERQGHLDTHITTHEINDISKMKSILKKAKLLVRVNPIYKNSRNEIDEVINNGADIVMLPMFKEKWEVNEFIKIVNRRATTCLLLETIEAVKNLDDILNIKGIDEIHVGLNDLHLGMQLKNMFQVISIGLLDEIVKKIKDKDIKFGFGGIAKLGTGEISADLILAEHARIGSSMVILSRKFVENRESYNSYTSVNLKSEISKIKQKYNSLKNSDYEIKQDLHNELVKIIEMRSVKNV